MGYTAGTMGTAGMTLMGAGAATSAIGSYYGAQSQQIGLESAANIAAINARQSELSAQQELLKGNTAVANVTARAGQIKASQTNAMAANGIALGQGSASEVLASTDLMKERDVNTITANAVRSAWGYRTQETNFQNDALTKRAGADAISPFTSGATSLLGSAGGVARNWYSQQKVGVAPNSTGD